MYPHRINVSDRHKSYTLYTILQCIKWASFHYFLFSFVYFHLLFLIFVGRMLRGCFQKIEGKESQNKQTHSKNPTRVDKELFGITWLGRSRGSWGSNEHQMGTFWLQTLKNVHGHSTKERNLGLQCKEGSCQSIEERWIW